MSGGSASLYGFIYQLFLSLVAALDGAIADISVELKVSLDNGGSLSEAHPESALVERAIRQDGVAVEIVLEGESDIDLYHSNGSVEYVQAKAHPQAKSHWTIAELFKEVIWKLPIQRGEVSKGYKYTLVTDVDLNDDCTDFKEVCEWMSQISKELPSDANNAAWKSLLASADDNGLIVNFPRSFLWDNQALKCRARELPEKLTYFQSFRKRADSQNENEKSRETQDALYSLADICRFLAGFSVLTSRSLDHLKERVYDRIRGYAPTEEIDSLIDQLIATAWKLAIQPAKTKTSGYAFLRGVGIMGKRYSRDNMLQACKALVQNRYNSFVTNADIPQPAPRYAADESFDRFLKSTASRIFILSGPPRYGKSRQLAEWARREAESIPTYFETCILFDWNKIGERICQEMGHEGVSMLNTSGLIQRLYEMPPSKQTVILLFLDAIDEVSDEERLRVKLQPVLDCIGRKPINLVISCKSSEWERFKDIFEPFRMYCFPPLERTNTEDDNAFLPSSELKLLDKDELKEGLRLNSLSVTVEPHPAPLSVSLAHPSLLNTYFKLDEPARNNPLQSGVYATQMYDIFWQGRLTKWEQLTKQRKQLLEASLQQLARKIREQHDADNAMSLASLMSETFPIEMKWGSLSFQSPSYEAVRLGIIRETNSDNSLESIRISFGPDLLLEFILSKTLEAELPSADQAAQFSWDLWLQAIIAEMFNNRFDPLFYALAFLVQTLCLRDDNRVEPLLQSIISNFDSTNTELFVLFVSDPSSRILERLVAKKDSTIGQVAANCLAIINTATIRKAFVDLLNNPTLQVRECVLAAINGHPQIAVGDMNIVRQLIEISEDPDNRWSEQIPSILAKSTYIGMDEGHRNLLALLEQHTTDPRPYVRLRCIHAIMEVAHQSSLPVLRTTLNETEDPDTQVTLAAAIAEYGHIEDADRLSAIIERASPTTSWGIYLKAWTLGKLIDIDNDKYWALAERVLRQSNGQSPHIHKQIFSAIARTEATEKALNILDESVQNNGPISRSDALKYLASIHTPSSMIALLRSLVNDFSEWKETKSQISSEVNNASAANRLYRIFSFISDWSTTKVVDTLLNLGDSQPQLTQDLEEICNHLLVNEKSKFLYCETAERESREFSNNLLIAIQSELLKTVWLQVLPLEEDIFFLEKIIRDIGVLGDEEILVSLIETEIALRTTNKDLKNQKHTLISEIAKAIGTIGGRQAFDALLNMLRYYEPLPLDIPHAMPLIRPEDRDPIGLLALVTDQDVSSRVQAHATYALSILGATELAPQLLDIFLNSANDDVRYHAAQAFGRWGYQEAIKPLQDVVQESDDTLRGACEEALCCLGCEQTAKRLLGLSSLQSESGQGAIEHLTNYIVDDLLSQQIDHYLVEQINSVNYILRYKAMRAILQRHSQGHSVQGASEALCNFLRREKHSGFTANDDQEAPAILAILSPHELCKVANEIEYIGWSEQSRQSMAEALGFTRLSEAVSGLRRLLQDDKYKVRRAAAYALSCCPGQAVETALKELLSGSVSQIVRVAEALLWFDKRWADDLRHDLEIHEDGRVRKMIRQVNSGLENRKAALELVGRLRDPSTKSGKWAYASALQKIGDERTIQTLYNFAAEAAPRWDISTSVLARQCAEIVTKELNTQLDHAELVSDI
ncbi:MAG TPA: HEAT repeat domain-containing protein [Chthonomonadaceae bacterium]|nr:HEAT repeat domain-containing protein [Chthonomonadaceae bacterium]